MPIRYDRTKGHGASLSPELANLLSDLPTALSGHLFARATRTHLKANQALFRAGDFGNGCYCLQQGVVKVVVSSAHDEERIIAVLGPGSIVGELSVIDGLPRSASVIAIRNCELQFISRESFDKCAKQHPEIYQYLTTMLASRLRDADEVMAATSFMTIKGRLARALLELAEHLGEADGAGRTVLSHKISQNELAAMAGIARENVSRILAAWQQRKIVTQSSSSRYYCFNDIAALKREMDLATSMGSDSAERT